MVRLVRDSGRKSPLVLEISMTVGILELILKMLLTLLHLRIQHPCKYSLNCYQMIDGHVEATTTLISSSTLGLDRKSLIIIIYIRTTIY